MINELDNYTDYLDSSDCDELIEAYEQKNTPNKV